MAQYEFFLTHSLEKVFPEREPDRLEVNPRFSGMKNEKLAFQMVVRNNMDSIQHEDTMIKLEICGPLKECFRVRSVELIPSEFPAFEEKDDNYITTEPGLFPDLLKPVDTNEIILNTNGYQSFWIDTLPEKELLPGEYQMQVKIQFKDDKLEIPFTIDVIDINLPKQDIIHTQWFHSDCIADYYKMEVFGEEHWEAIENYIQVAAQECAMNTILTPIFTPPLDTEVGGERTTVQLLDIEIVNDAYVIGYDKLRRWCEICRKHDIEYLEMAHFFTQWGAKATPKVMAMINGVEQRIFGWDVEATSPEYRKFMETLIPELINVLETCGYDRDHVMFHVSDEPEGHNLDSYKAAVKQVEDLLEGYTIMDALSEFDFYQEGLVKTPICANDRIQPFLDADITNLWVYYCCAQKQEVPNRFFAMPSARNRIMGVLIYLYDIKGFLQWGYNFYNTRFSIEKIDPYVMTHAGYSFPSGDSYLVYPGEGGQAYTSIRAEVTTEFFQDIRAFKLLEKLTSREFVKNLIYENVDYVMTFNQYPKESRYLLNLRTKVDLAIKTALHQ